LPDLVKGWTALSVALRDSLQSAHVMKRLAIDLCDGTSAEKRFPFHEVPDHALCQTEARRRVPSEAFRYDAHARSI